jgi:hypothetical protein
MAPKPSKVRRPRKDDSLVPKPKVAAGGIAGAVSVIVIWAAGVAGLDVPPEVASAVTVVVSFAAGYIKSE